LNSDNGTEIVQSVISVVMAILLGSFPLLYLIGMLVNHEKIEIEDPSFSGKFSSFWTDLDV